VAFDFSSLIRSSASRVTVLTNLTVASSEEILFRGLVLYALVRVWGDTKRGLVGSVVLTSLLFSVLPWVRSVSDCWRKHPVVPARPRHPSRTGRQSGRVLKEPSDRDILP
jgi:hypothetical protein